MRSSTSIWRIILNWMLLFVPAALHAQFTYTTNADGASLTVTGYSGPPWNVSIPANVNGLTVNNINQGAFLNDYSLTSITIPNTVTNVGDSAFGGCFSLVNVTMTNGLTSIASGAFGNCTGLYSVTIPASVTNIGQTAFGGCQSLTCAYFCGNAPASGGPIFENDHNPTVFYLPGTTGWSNTFGENPAVEIPFTFRTNNGAITVTGYVGTGGTAIIPDQITGCL